MPSIALGLGVSRWRRVAPTGPSNPFPAFEAAQTDYFYDNIGYDGPLPDPTIAAATLQTVAVPNNLLTGPLPDFSGCGSLVSMDINNNATFTGTLNCDLLPSSLSTLFVNDTGITAISNIGGLTALNLFVADNTALTAIPDIALCASLSTFGADLCPITSMAGTVFPNSLDTFEAFDCGMSSALVDQILVALATATANNGYAGLTGNTAPGASGVAAKATLEARGWTVDVDA